ncbi:PilZ domain-containing protein [Alteromonadaceae bacterium M269]|nr:PilZ domain-containing protein [Alteromonadaceae bacterium M269]
MISTQKTGKSSSFSPIIKKLQFEHQSPQLTQLIKNELGSKSISNGDLFYIKSEIKRKAKPCSRLIDLRSISNNAALSTFTWDKLAHVMDKPSAEHFIKLTRKYGGKYTFGVYEGVIDNFKSSKDKVKAEQLNHDVSIDKVSLCEVYRRHEERMNLGVKISVFPLASQAETLEYSEIEAQIQSDLHKASNTTQVDGHTANISVNGLQIKLRKDFSVGEIIAIRFTGLEADFVFKQKYIAYQVVRSDLVEDGKVHLISLSQLDLETHDEFKQFTKKIIYANKKRYKVRLDNTLVSVRSKFYEQFYLSRRNALDVFTKRDGNLAYIFSSEPALDMIE